MNAALVILCIVAQAEVSLPAPSLEADEPAVLARELSRQGIAVLQVIDVRTSTVSPLPRMRQIIRLPFPSDGRIFIVDGNHRAFDAMFAVRLQPDGDLRRIDGFALGRMVVVGVSESLKKRYDDVLRHEMVHAYLNVVAPERNLPTWLEEGLACYFSGSPSHLSDETYRRYERDMKYLFATHSEGMPRFLADAMTSSDPNEALFLHFRIPSAVHLHLMRLTWENAFWMALVLIPALSVVLGRFLSELLYPWYVGWRRRHLSWRYTQALRSLDRGLRHDLQPPALAFAAGARKAVSLAETLRACVYHALRWSQELEKRLWSSAGGLIQQIAPCVWGFGVNGGRCVQGLERLRSFSATVDKLMAADLSEEEAIISIKEVFDRLERSSEAMAALARLAFHGPWVEPAQECMEANVKWRRSRSGLEKALLEAVRCKRDLESELVNLEQYGIPLAAQEHPLGHYSVRVRDTLLAWEHHSDTLQDTIRSLQEAETKLLMSLRERSPYGWAHRALRSGLRLDSLLLAAAEPEAQRAAELRRLARSWARQDFVPRVRRDGFARWLRPPDALEMACFSLFFATSVAGWTSLRRSCAFFLMGLDRLLGG